MKFLNTIICYNNSKEVIKYIRSLLDIKKDNLSFAIVVNAGSKRDINRLERFSTHIGFEKVNMFIPNRNLGYLNGMIYGYKCYVKKYSKPDYVIFSNTDIKILDKCFFDKFERYNYPSNIGCIGPSIYVKDRKAYDNPVLDERRSNKQINRLISILSIPLIRGLYVNLSDYKGRFTHKEKTKSRFVYEVHGCFFILSNLFTEHLVEKEYGALLYSEEAYIAENIMKFNFMTYYDSRLEVIHLEHSVTKGLKGEKIARYIRDSMKLIKEEFYLNE